MIINRGKEPEWKLIIRTERDKERIFLGGDAQNKRNSLRFFPFSSVSYTFVFPVHLYYYKFTYSYFLDRISREGWQLLDRETRTLPYRFLLEFFLKSFSFVSRSSNHSSSFVESEERREGKGRRRRRRSKAHNSFPDLSPNYSKRLHRIDTCRVTPPKRKPSKSTYTHTLDQMNQVWMCVESCFQFVQII